MLTWPAIDLQVTMCSNFSVHEKSVFQLITFSKIDQKQKGSEAGSVGMSSMRKGQSCLG
jgi:hypothetical protein